MTRSLLTTADPLWTNCSGPLSEYKLCNTERCPPGSEDFTDVQCSAFNNRYMGDGRRIVRWLAVERRTQKRNPCELRCRSEDSTMTFSFGKMTDGTPCGHSKICIDGRCKDIGCDGTVESGVRVDECGVCGGKNLSCVQVQQMSSTQGELYKYMAVTIIPSGATNIRVEDDSHNVLTLWDQWPSRSIVPNKGITNKTIVWESRKLSGGTSTILAGGTSFTHEMAENGSEALTAVGPTMKPVTLAVYIAKKGNSSIRYQYWVPKEDNVLRSAARGAPTSLVYRAGTESHPAEHHYRRARVHAGPLLDNAIPFLGNHAATGQPATPVATNINDVVQLPAAKPIKRTKQKNKQREGKEGKVPRVSPCKKSVAPLLQK